jgi:uncharacterized protein (DUF2267 family)
MNLAELYDRVAHQLPEDFDVPVELLIRGVLAEIAERLRPEEAAELGAELPEELGDILAQARGDGHLERDEFLESLAARLDVDDHEAELGAHVVLASVRELLEPILAMDEVLEALPPDLAQMMS